MKWLQPFSLHTGFNVKQSKKETSRLMAQANQYFLDGRYIDALPIYKRLVFITPKNADLHCNLASTLKNLGYYEEATKHFEKALSITPNNRHVLNNYAGLLDRLEKYETAINLLKQLANLIPNDALILRNVAGSLYNLSLKSNNATLKKEALLWFDKSLQIDQKISDTHYGKAIVLADIGCIKEAISHCHLAIELKPSVALPRLLLTKLVLPIVSDSIETSATAIINFHSAVMELGNWVESNSYHLESLGAIAGDSQPFSIAYIQGNHCPILSIYGDILSRSTLAYWNRHGLIPFQIPPKRPRIRLGIICEQIRQHSVWYVIVKGIVKNLNRQCFELFLYHTGNIIDDETDWAKSVSDGFVQGAKTPIEWIQIIQNDAPDILFFPEIGMGEISFKLACLRLATLQVASWGHPISSGLPNIDIYFSGELIERENADDHYREKLIRLPSTGVCTESIAIDDELLFENIINPKVNQKVIRFLICQSAFKLDPIDDKLLAEVIHQAQPCELYIVRSWQHDWESDFIKNRLNAAFKAVGLEPENCLIEIPWIKPKQFSTFLNEMDIYLDMPAFSGYTTALQAVRQGIPIVTLEGEFMRQRLAAGLLRKIELTETIASSHSEYIVIATKLAEECRIPQKKLKRRTMIALASTKSNNDLSVVRAFENALIKKLFELKTFPTAGATRSGL